MNADDRAATRLTNQRELTTTADTGAENGTTLVVRVRGCSSPLVWVLPFSFAEISASNLTVVFCGSWESHW